MWTEGVVKRRRWIGSAIVYLYDGLDEVLRWWWRFRFRGFCDFLVAVIRIGKARVVSECICIWYTYTLP
jgi:hypothetical protein